MKTDKILKRKIRGKVKTSFQHNNIKYTDKRLEVVVDLMMKEREKEIAKGIEQWNKQ